MSFLPEDLEWARGVDHRAFTNGAERATWMSQWCARCLFSATCPLVHVAAAGRTPAAWHENSSGDRDGRYTCTEWVQWQ